MTKTLVCPRCGTEDRLEILFDAWIRYKVIGLDDDSDLAIGSESTIQQFDYNEIECTVCEGRFSASAIIGSSGGRSDGLPAPAVPPTF